MNLRIDEAGLRFRIKRSEFETLKRNGRIEGKMPTTLLSPPEYAIAAGDAKDGLNLSVQGNFLTLLVSAAVLEELSAPKSPREGVSAAMGDKLVALEIDLKSR